MVNAKEPKWYPCQFCVEEHPGSWYMRLHWLKFEGQYLKASISSLRYCLQKLLKIWCFCSSLPWDVFLPLIYQLSFKRPQYFLATFKLATGFHEITFCHLVESAEFNSWDWISALCFKQSHELVTNWLCKSIMFSPLIWADKSYMWDVAFLRPDLWQEHGFMYP